jgi:hypothetical protein
MKFFLMLLTCFLSCSESTALNHTAISSSSFSNVADGNLYIKLIEMNDSRCPTGTVCIWEGTAAMKILIGTSIENAEEYSIETNGKDSIINYKYFSITVNKVDPYPVNGSTYKLSDYILDLTITQN